MARFKGTRDDDDIEGTDAKDTIYGLGGDDYLFGYGGNDRIEGGAGSDWAYGGDGNDVMLGGDGDDYLRGESGDDHLEGGTGDDILRGAEGVDSFVGGDGVDRVSFYDASATQGVIADLRTQTIANDGYGNAETMISIEGLGGGTAFADILDGDDTSNLLFGSDGDRVSAHGGDDELQIGGMAGAIIDGGEGIDQVLFVGYKYVVVDGSFSTIYAEAGMTIDLAKGVVSNDGFGGRGTLTGVETIISASESDRIFGSGAGEEMRSGYGDDILNGRGGADVLEGGPGSDKLTGGGGADVFSFNLGDWLPETTEAEIDTITDFAQGSDKMTLVNGGTFDDPDATRFTFIGTDQFSGAANEIRYEIRSGNTYVYVESDGQPGIDFTIKVVGAITLVASDFIL